jgi:hypothetical protein
MRPWTLSPFGSRPLAPVAEEIVMSDEYRELAGISGGGRLLGRNREAGLADEWGSAAEGGAL